MGAHDRVQEMADRLSWRFLEARWPVSERGGAEIITRYTDLAGEVPKHDLDAIADYLRSADCFSTFMVDGVGLPTGSAWQTVEVFVDEGAREGEMRKRRLLHTVVRKDQGDDADFVVENGCRYHVTVRDYENQAVFTAPDAGSSGVRRSVFERRRDEQTKLWSWKVETRVRVTQTTGVYQSEDDRAKGVERQDWLGVYEGDKDNTGAAVGLWAVTDAVQGVLIEERREKNEDCTVDVRQVRTTGKARANVRRGVERTLRKWSAEAVDEGQSAAVIAGVDAAGGVVTRREAVEGADGLFVNTVRTVTEKALEDAETLEAEDDEREVSEALDENQAAEGAAAAAVAGTTEEVRNSRTEGGLWNVRRRVTVFKKWLSQVVRGRVTLTEVVTGSLHRALTAAEADVYAAEAAAAGSGHWFETVRTKRPDGKQDFELVDHEEKVRDGVRRGSAKTAFEHREFEEKVEAAAAAAAAAVTGGVLQEVESEETQGGFFRNRRTERAAQYKADFKKEVQVFPYGKRTRKGHTNAAVPYTEASAVGVTTSFEINQFDYYDTFAVVWSTEAFQSAVLRTVTSVEGPVRQVTTETANLTNALFEETNQTPGTVRVRESWKHERGGSYPYDTRERVETAEKWTVTDTVPDVGGAVTVLRYGNYTAAEEEALVDALTGGNRNSWSPSGMNRFRLYDGVITVKDLGAEYTALYRIDKEDLVEYTKPVTMNRGGALKSVSYKLVYNLKLDKGVSAGLTAYDGAKGGSWWRNMGKDWYFYKKVTKIYMKEADYTPSATDWVEV